MKNPGAILRQAGTDYTKIVKTTIFLTDMNDLQRLIRFMWSLISGGDFPARSCVQVAKLPLGGLVEVGVHCTTVIIMKGLWVFRALFLDADRLGWLLLLYITADYILTFFYIV